MAAALPHRVANALLPRGTGVARSSRGAQGLMDRTAEALQTWQAARATQAAEAVAAAWASGDGRADRRVESAMDGVTAHIDGRWQPPQVATILGRRLAPQTEEPTLGAILARRYVGGLGPAEELATRIPQVRRAAGGEHLPRGEIWGDGAPGIWHVADASVPGVRQTLDDSHLRAPL